MSLGGSIFTHNAIEFDYCIEASIASLCGVCDEVVVLDAESTDETVDVLNECVKKFNNLKVITGAKWNCASNYNRLAILANQAASYLKTTWHFMLQADEVIHENSYNNIRNIVKQNSFDSYFCRRINLFGDMNHYLRFDLEHHKKPCNDIIIRLANRKYLAVGDAESLGVDPKTLCVSRADDIQIWHYGYVRRDANCIKKVIDMQSWFHGEGSQPDSRVVEMQQDGIFKWENLKEKVDLAKISWYHPFVAQNWVKERQKEKRELND